MNQDTLKTILADHAQWLATDGKEGAQANLSWADLTDATLIDADLAGANLIDADLAWADLTGATIIPGYTLTKDHERRNK